MRQITEAKIGDAATMTEAHLNSEQLRVLRLLSDAEPGGVAETLWAAHGLSGELLSSLVLAGLATMEGDTVRTDGDPIEAVLVRITTAGGRRSRGERREACGVYGSGNPKAAGVRTEGVPRVSNASRYVVFLIGGE